MRRTSFSPYNKPFVKFSDIDGAPERAIDERGPSRELFRLALDFLKGSSMFTGVCKKHLTHRADIITRLGA